MEQQDFQEFKEEREEKVEALMPAEKETGSEKRTVTPRECWHLTRTRQRRKQSTDAASRSTSQEKADMKSG